MSENKLDEKFLPMGSVVVVKDGKRPVMINSRLSIHVETNKLYDYSAVPYPEGLVQSNQSMFFNHEDIRLVLFKGYEDEMETAFQEVLTKMEKSWK